MPNKGNEKSTSKKPFEHVKFDSSSLSFRCPMILLLNKEKKIDAHAYVFKANRCFCSYLHLDYWIID